MPKPRKNESRSKFLSRCIPQAIKEGRPQKQAIAMCLAMFRRKEMSTSRHIKEGDKMPDVSQVGVELTLEGKDEMIEGLDQVEQKVEQVLDKAEQLDDTVKSMHEDEAKDYGMMATSFDELETMEQAAMQVGMVRELTDQFAQLAKNVMYSETVEDKETALVELANEYTSRVSDAMSTKEKWQPLTDYASNFLADLRKAEKPMKTERGVKHPASDYAYVPDPEKPSTWKLPMAEGKPGNITVAQLGRAAAAFSPGGFRGKKVQIPSGKIAGVKAKLRAAYKKLDAEIPESIKKELDQTSFAVWKEKDGTYKFLTVYSNNFRDNDNPPEIIAEASHRRFDALLESKNVDYPDVWLWHVKDWTIGKVTGHAWDDSGFAVATGIIDNKEIAEWLVSQGENVRVSHGMPSTSIKRDEKDNTIIVEHITREISPLPAWAAANKLTGFVVLKEKEENSMSIPKEKRDALVDLGLSATVLDALEKANAETAEQAKESGLESKEAEDVLEEVETANENPSEETLEEGGEDETPEVVEVGPDRKEIADAIIAAVQPQNEAVKELNQNVVDLVSIVKSLKEEVDALKKSDSEKVAEKAAGTPAASLISMLKGQSAIGSPEAKLDGRKALAKAGPAITEDDEKAKRRVSPIPFVNDIMNSQKGEEVRLI